MSTGRKHGGGATTHQMIQAGICSAKPSGEANNGDYSMYVGSLHKDNTINAMKDYLSKCGLSVSYITIVSPHDKYYKSYHIMMKMKDYYCYEG